jgi:hypothetical protein
VPNVCLNGLTPSLGGPLQKRDIMDNDDVTATVTLLVLAANQQSLATRFRFPQ